MGVEKEGCRGEVKKNNKVKRKIKDKIRLALKAQKGKSMGGVRNGNGLNFSN